MTVGIFWDVNQVCRIHNKGDMDVSVRHVGPRWQFYVYDPSYYQTQYFFVKKIHFYTPNTPLYPSIYFILTSDDLHFPPILSPEVTQYLGLSHSHSQILPLDSVKSRSKSHKFSIFNQGYLVQLFTTRGVVAPPKNDPIMSGTLIRSFRHL